MSTTHPVSDFSKHKIYVIYVGGIIGMAKTDSGYVPVPGYLKQLMDRNPSFNSGNIPQYTLVEYSPLIDSSNVCFESDFASAISPT